MFSAAAALTLLTLAILPASTTLSPDDDTGPKVRVDSLTATWTETIQGDPFQHEFTIHNDGDQPLEILHVIPNCGCLTIESKPEAAIPPGGSGTITLAIDTSNLLGDDVRKGTTVRTSDRRSGPITLTLHGKVRALFRLKPKDLVARVYPNQTPKIEATLEPATELGGAIEKVHVEDPTVKVATTPLEGGGATITITGPPHDAIRTFGHHMKIDVRTSDGKLRKTRITCRFEFRARWELLSPALDGTLYPARFVTFAKDEVRAWLKDPSQPLEKRLTVRAVDPKFNFRVTGTRFDRAPNDLYGTTIETVREGQEYTVVVRLLRKPEGRIARGRLFVVTDDPEIPEQRVDLRAFSGK
ncbi:MAG: DUF1573 domain-containing protein [Planctomycetota bacterium]